MGIKFVHDGKLGNSKLYIDGVDVTGYIKSIHFSEDPATFNFEFVGIGFPDTTEIEVETD